MNTTSKLDAQADAADNSSAPDEPSGPEASTPPATPAAGSAPGVLPFEDFDLDDIELIESKVFA